MNDLKLNSNNDLVIENNDFVFLEGVDYVKQKLSRDLKTFLGECFMDTTIGIPYFQEIFIKGTTINRIAAIYKAAILQTFGVIEILDFNMDYNNANRNLIIDFLVNSEEGTIKISEEIAI